MNDSLEIADELALDVSDFQPWVVGGGVTQACASLSLGWYVDGPFALDMDLGGEVREVSEGFEVDRMDCGVGNGCGGIDSGWMG